MTSYYEQVIAKSIPGGTGGFELSIRGCAKERYRAIRIAKDADREIKRLRRYEDALERIRDQDEPQHPTGTWARDVAKEALDG